MVSATINDHVQKFAAQTLRSPKLLQTQDLVFTNYKLPSTLEQLYVVVNSKMRLAILIALLAQHSDKRSLVFVESKPVCDFLVEILNRVQIEFNILSKGGVHVLHGGIKAEDRVRIWKQYMENGGILITTDVAARGLNLGSQNAKKAKKQKAVKLITDDDLGQNESESDEDSQEEDDKQLFSGVDVVI